MTRAVVALRSRLALAGSAVPWRLPTCIGVLSIALVPLGAYALEAAGSLDPSFARGGTTTLDFGDGNSGADAVALQPDGKIVVAGSTTTAGGYEFAVARLHADGTPDESFSADGRQTLQFAAGADDQATALTVQPDGRIVVAGVSAQRPVFAAVARLLPTGELDSSFSEDGLRVFRFSPDGFLDSANAILDQPDGNLIVAGESTVDTGTVPAVARLNPDGSLDAGFSGDGRMTIRLAPRLVMLQASATDLAIQDDGRIVVALNHFPARRLAGRRYGVARLTLAGGLDRSFAGDGVREIGIPDFVGSTAVAIQGNGKILSSGASEILGGVPSDDVDRSVVTRLTTRGRLDHGFGGDGKKVLKPSLGAGIAIQSDGKVIVVGTNGRRFAVARVGRRGGLDASFGGRGRVMIPIGSARRAAASAVAIQSDGGIVVAGTAGAPSAGADIAVARLSGG